MIKRGVARGHLAIFISVIFFGFNIPVLKELMPKWKDGYDATLFRIGGATVLFWITSIFIKSKPIDKSDRLTIFLSGMVGLFLFIFLFNLSLQYGSPVDISIIMTTPPVMVVLLSALFYKTKLSFWKLFGLIISISGAVMLILIGGTQGGKDRSMTGNLLAALSAVCYSFYILSMKNCSEKYHPVTLLKWVFLSACVGAIPFGLVHIFKAPIILNPEPLPWLMIAFIIIFPTFISYLLIPPAIKLIGHELVSMYQYLIPVIATATAIALKISKLYWDQPVAVAIIFLGVFISSRAVGKEREKNNNNSLKK